MFFPLEHRFKQNAHVRNRLERYEAVRRISFAHCDAKIIAAAIWDDLFNLVQSIAVERNGAQRVAIADCWVAVTSIKSMSSACANKVAV